MADFGMADLFERCPDLAVRETRTVFVPPGDALPAGEYGFLENYCVDSSCDCRRVVIRVCNAQNPTVALATINYGWETEEFYRGWFKSAPPDEAAEMARDITGTCLDLINPQSDYADYFLALFREMIAHDADYVARLARHYREFRRQGNPRRSGNTNRQRPKRRRR